MSSGQGENVSSNAEDDKDIKPDIEASKLASKDQVDHASKSSVDKEEPFMQHITEDTSDKTDSGFKDTFLSNITNKTKSNSDNMDDNSDEDIELKWEDDDTEEQNITPVENVQEVTEHVSKVVDPLEADVDDSNLSITDATDDIDGKTEEIDENELLESSPSDNDDTNLASTEDLDKTNTPLNNIVRIEAISDDTEEIIDENQLLEGPESDTLNEENILENPDENLEDSLSNDDLTNINQSSTQIITEKPVKIPLLEEPKGVSTIDKTPEIDLEKDLDSQYIISKETLIKKKDESISTQSLLSNKENKTNVISDLATTPIQDNSLVLSPSSPNDSLMDTSLNINTGHGLNKPDMMLEIPTQEVIELIDDTDISISLNDDDKMEVDDLNDSSKTDVAIEVEKPALEEKTDAIILKPIDLFREIDTEKPIKDDSNEARIKDVSEDDWSEIERKLEGFEDSFSETSQLNKKSKVKEPKIVEGTQIKDDDDTENSEKVKENTESEDKELLKTLLDTSKLGSTDHQISTTMDVEEQRLADIEGQPLIESPLKATQVVDKDDIAPEKDVLSVLEKTNEVTSSNKENEKEKTSDLENQKLESIKPKSKTDNVDTKPMSPSKDIEDMEIQEETTKEQLETSKLDTKASTTDLSSLIEEKTTKLLNESTKLIDEVETSKTNVQLSKQTDKDVVSTLENIEDQKSTKQSDKVVLSSTIYPNKIENQPVEQLADNNMEPSSSKLNINIDKVVPSTSIDTKTVTPSTANETKNEVQPSTSGELPSTSKLDDEISSSSDIELQPSTSTMEVESTNKVELTSVDDIPSASKTDDIDIQASTSRNEVVPSTSKAADNIEVQPSTSTDVVSTSVIPTNTDPESDEGPEISDSLGLLAESSRVMEDDEEQDEDDEADGDDDDDYDQEDESSNQMTAEHSEDSNAPHSETELPKDQDEKEMEVESPMEEKGENEFNFAISDVGTEEKDGAIEEEKDGDIEEEKDGDIDVDEDTVQDDIEVTNEQIGNEVSTDDVPATETTAEPKEDDKDKPKQADTDAAKLSDKTDNESKDSSMLRKLLAKEESTSEAKSSPSKKLGFARQSHTLNIVDLEESSSEDDIQEVTKDGTKESGTLISFDGYKITIPSSVDVSSVPILPSEVAGEEPVVTDGKSTDIPAKVDSKPSEEKAKPKFSLEIFNLDSDDEENAAVKTDKTKTTNKCINISCTSSGDVAYYPADEATIFYYDAAKQRKALVCEVCADTVAKRAERLINGIKDLTPLLELDTCKLSTELVEISDSESDDEADTSDEPRNTIGETGASFLEENLAKMINETWTKFCLDSRLNEAQDDLTKEMDKLEAESKEIDAMLSECQVATDKLRNNLYATFEHRRCELGAITIFDTPVSKYSCAEREPPQTDSAPETRAKRRMSSAAETPAKRPAIPLGYTPLGNDVTPAQIQDNKSSMPTVENTKAEDDKDISVLKVSAEAAPSDLPPPGELARPPLRAGMCVFAMRNAFGCWIRSRVLEVNGKSAVLGMSQTFTVCRVKYEHKPKGSTKLSPARCLAYSEPASVRLTIGTRVIALFKDSQNPLKKDAFYSGIISEVPNPVNNYRYLVFFDDGYAQYVQHRDTRVVCECAALVWEEVHPFSREFVREYLLAYPERPMVRLHAGQSLKTEWNGKWWTSRVIQVDASLVQVHFEEDNRSEWIYRGSTRLAPLFLELQAAERHRARPMPRTKAQPRINMPYVEYTRSDEQNKSEPPATQAPPVSDREIRQRAVAKKSTAMPPAPNIPPPTADSVTSRVVYYTPKNAVKPYKMTSHNCGPQCKRKDVLALKDLRTYNPLAKPLLSGWERQIVRYKGHKEVMYRAPCGRRLRSMRELHRYLRLVHSDMPVDLFDFTPHTHCLAEFVLNKCLVGKKDLSHGKENVPVPCVNYYDESLPEFCSYNTERTPTAGVPLNLDPEFLCGCDCTDDCEDKSKCACWQMTLEGARTIGLGGPNVGYKYKRLPEPLPSGIYECNSRCKCKNTCLNRVAQHPLQLKLQVFKTLNRGWGIRALNDIPKGSFLCVYAGNLLTDATANMDGLNEGDEYLAELDYIEVVEQMKEGYEEDIPETDKRLDKKNAVNAADESEASTSEDDDEKPSKDEQEDGDFFPGHIGMGVSEFSKRLRKRDKSKKKNKQDGGAKEKEKDGDKTGDDCITISDDEEVREPSRFMAQAGMGKEFISKYRSVRSYFGKDEACYIMDAKVQGNIGRYLNHSCQPNVFVQNVFVDTHDPRFPWVAFFALSHIKAGTELTWNYNYDVGSVPGKVLYCYCGAHNCRGRLL